MIFFQKAYIALNWLFSETINEVEFLLKYWIKNLK